MPWKFSEIEWNHFVTDGGKIFCHSWKHNDFQSLTTNLNHGSTL